MAAKQPKGPIDAALARLPADLLARLLGSSSQHDPIALRRRSALASDGDEALRLLKSKRASLAPKGDTPVARAVLVVDYLSRNAPEGTDGYCRMTLPPATLAKAAGLGVKKGELRKLENMRTVLASYLDGTSIGRKGRRSGQGGGGQRGRKRDASSLKADAAASSSAVSRQTVHNVHPSELMHDMCIRLGPVIPDAEYATAYATRLLEALANMGGTERQAAASKRRRFSKHELRRDMERHREYYEAACFYLAVKKSEGESAQLLKNAQKPAAKKDAKKKGKSASRKEDGEYEDAVAEEEEEDDADEERTLTEADIVSAANLLEGTFQTVLDYVKEWTAGISIEVLPEKMQTAAPPKALFQVANGTGGGADASKSEPMESPFEQWKRVVLREAKASALKNMKGEESKDWLKVAADEVLRNAGL